MLERLPQNRKSNTTMLEHFSLPLLSASMLLYHLVADNTKNLLYLLVADNTKSSLARLRLFERNRNTRVGEGEEETEYIVTKTMILRA